MPTRHQRALVAIACIASASLLCASSSGGAAMATAASTGAEVGAAGVSTLGLAGWEVQSSSIATQSGGQISRPGFATGEWLTVKPDDAGAPGTEIEALLQNGACPNVFFSTNMRRCFGYQRRVGAVTTPRFAVPWWFRTDFALKLAAGVDARLIINGIVGQADVWVDGSEVATQRAIQGDFTRYTIDISSVVHRGANALALAVYPNNPKSMYTLDDVDWNQIPPDNNTGIQFPIQLSTSRSLSIGDAHVLQDNAADLSESSLTVEADVTNSSTMAETGTVVAEITPPRGGGAPIEVSRSVTVPAGTTRAVSFEPASYARLSIRHPRLWWPYQMGGQPLYTLSTWVIGDRFVASAATEHFGIRTVRSYLTAPSNMAPHGVRVYAVNGVPFLFRAGGWSEDLFLHYSASDLANQISLIKTMGLNGIRTEGHEMPDGFYDQMDRAGVMIDAGFQCCDKWQPPQSGAGLTAHDYSIMFVSARTIGEHLRNHPSVISFSWSDNAPIRQQEVVSLKGFAAAGFQDPIVSSAEYKSSPLLGPSGEKEGPYDWVPPGYWYDTTHANPGDPSQTNAGGSWAFDSEQSAGDTVPTLDSIRRFMSPHDQAELWTNPSFNQYHTDYEPGHTGYAFGTLFNLDRAISDRYGPWSSLGQYVEEAQLQNYEDARAQFEAFIDHWTNQPTPATGTVYWQLNKGWPTLLWDLYNSDYDQAGSYFGAEKANERLHVLYAYDNNTVTVDNLTGDTQSDLSVTSRVYSIDGRVLDEQEVSTGALPSQGVRNAVITPRVPRATTPPTPASTFFVELSIEQRGVVVDRNVYWLSTQQDAVNWRATVGNPQATMSRYADLRSLHDLPSARVAVLASTKPNQGSGNDRSVTTVVITNTSTAPTVGLFLRADVRRGKADGTELPADNQVLPITWSDDDVTLWPGESETLTATYATAQLDGAQPVVSVYGWNVARLDVPAPQSGAMPAPTLLHPI